MSGEKRPLPLPIDELMSITDAARMSIRYKKASMTKRLGRPPTPEELDADTETERKFIHTMKAIERLGIKQNNNIPNSLLVQVFLAKLMT